MHVDITLPLWAFWDVYGNTSKIRLIGSTKEPVLRFNNTSSPLHSAAGIMSQQQASNQEQLSARNNNRVPDLDRSPQSILPGTNPNMSAACPAGTVAYPPTTNIESGLSRLTTDLNTSFGSNSGGGPSECTLCFENIIDCVLYTCGHMCMCYDCAIHQWKRGGGFCPLCRNDIRDVIRTFRS